jgi:hypothetical protein
MTERADRFHARPDELPVAALGKETLAHRNPGKLPPPDFVLDIRLTAPPLSVAPQRHSAMIRAWCFAALLGAHSESLGRFGAVLHINPPAVCPRPVHARLLIKALTKTPGRVRQFPLTHCFCWWAREGSNLQPDGYEPSGRNASPAARRARANTLIGSKTVLFITPPNA